jgi:general stress protein 26
MAKLRAVFAEWYNNGHTDESDPNTCILRIRLTDAVIFSNGTKYEIENFDTGTIIKIKE